MMIGTTLNSIIRADGNPKFAMTSMLAGAILNIILDPVFIFAFNMGVEGAAIATVISQFLTFILNIFYIRKFKSIKLSKEDFKFKFNLASKVSMLGISCFITQMAIVVVMAFENNLLGKSGKDWRDFTNYDVCINSDALGVEKTANVICELVNEKEKSLA